MTDQFYICGQWLSSWDTVVGQRCACTQRGPRLSLSAAATKLLSVPTALGEEFVIRGLVLSPTSCYTTTRTADPQTPLLMHTRLGSSCVSSSTHNFLTCSKPALWQHPFSRQGFVIRMRHTEQTDELSRAPVDTRT